MIILLPHTLHLFLLRYSSLSAFCQKKFAAELIFVRLLWMLFPYTKENKFKFSSENDTLHYNL